MLTILSQTKNIKVNNSNIILAHNELNKIQIKYNFDEFISDQEIKISLNKTNNIINKYLEKLEFDECKPTGKHNYHHIVIDISKFLKLQI